MVSAKFALIALPLIWNFLVLTLFGGFAILEFTSLYAALLGVAVGLAVAGSIKIFGSGIGDEGIHIGFIAGTLSGVYVFLSLGVLLGATTPNYASFGTWGPLGARFYPNPALFNSSNYVYPTGYSLKWLEQVPYGYVIEGIMALMFLIGIILYCSKTSD